MYTKKLKLDSIVKQTEKYLIIDRYLAGHIRSQQSSSVRYVVFSLIRPNFGRYTGIFAPTVEAAERKFLEQEENTIK